MLEWSLDIVSFPFDYCHLLFAGKSLSGKRFCINISYRPTVINPKLYDACLVCFPDSQRSRMVMMIIKIGSICFCQIRRVFVDGRSTVYSCYVAGKYMGWFFVEHLLVFSGRIKYIEVPSRDAIVGQMVIICQFKVAVEQVYGTRSLLVWLIRKFVPFPA